MLQAVAESQAGLSIKLFQQHSCCPPDGDHGAPRMCLGGDKGGDQLGFPSVGLPVGCFLAGKHFPVGSR